VHILRLEKPLWSQNCGWGKRWKHSIMRVVKISELSYFSWWTCIVVNQLNNSDTSKDVRMQCNYLPLSSWGWLYTRSIRFLISTLNLPPACNDRSCKSNSRWRNMLLLISLFVVLMRWLSEQSDGISHWTFILSIVSSASNWIHYRGSFYCEFCVQIVEPPPLLKW